MRYECVRHVRLAGAGRVETRGGRRLTSTGSCGGQGSVRNNIEEASGRGQAQIKKGVMRQAKEKVRVANFKTRRGEKAGMICKQRGSEERVHRLQRRKYGGAGRALQGKKIVKGRVPSHNVTGVEGSHGATKTRAGWEEEIKCPRGHPSQQYHSQGGLSAEADGERNNRRWAMIEKRRAEKRSGGDWQR
jgi:hypothetical protein